MKKIFYTLESSALILFLFVFILFRTTSIFADDTTSPTPPPQPTAPAAPQPPAPPVAPTAPPPPSLLSTPPTNTDGNSTPSPTSVSPSSSSTSTPPDPTNTSSTTSAGNADSPQQNSGQNTAAVHQSSTTGNNSSSDNVGNSTVSTQDANTSGTILNGVNTNLQNVSVSQFTIAGDHTGDIVLDFPANCILNCTTQQQATTTNAAGIGNTLALSANSGNNTTSQNTAGASAITSGNANVDANSLGFANNNFDGQVEFGVVNIYGNLTGDIILPDSALASLGTNTTTTNNGTGSSPQTTSQANGATITNSIKTSATTGNNSTTENTSGNNAIQTGQGSVDANSLTLANNNLDGGAWWLVLVNNNGNWSGQLLGGNGNTAASPGLNFSLGPSGDIATTNNGAGSQNTTTITDGATNTTGLSNGATLQNTLDLSANTGGNSADQNTGGATNISTGNAKIMANLVNFVNNNLSHGARLIVTVVNIFGTWVGDFVTPGHTKQNSNTQSASADSTSPATLTDPTLSSSTSVSSPAEDPLQASMQEPANTNNETVLVIASIHKPIIHIASIQYNKSAATKALKTLRINLAWLVIILPFLALGNLLRKKLLHRNG